MDRSALLAFCVRHARFCDSVAGRHGHFPRAVHRWAGALRGDGQRRFFVREHLVFHDSDFLQRRGRGLGAGAAADTEPAGRCDGTLILTLRLCAFARNMERGCLITRLGKEFLAKAQRRKVRDANVSQRRRGAKFVTYDTLTISRTSTTAGGCVSPPCNWPRCSGGCV